jgi:hypothetical protein
VGVFTEEDTNIFAVTPDGEMRLIYLGKKDAV